VTAVISPFSSIPTARVQLGHYAENHGVEGRVLLEEEEEEERWKRCKMMRRRKGQKKR